MTDRNRHVLFVHHYPAFGGPVNRVLRLAKPLAHRGWRVSIVLPAEAGNAVPWLRESGVDVIQTPLDRLRRVRDPRPNLAMLARARTQVQRLRKIISDTDASVVVPANLLMPHGAIAARLEHRAVLWQIVDTAVPPPLQVLTMPTVRLLADAVAYGGASLPSLHIGAERLPQPAFVIPPPVDTEIFKPDLAVRVAMRAELGIAPEVPLIGQIVAINPTKGLDNFLRAAAVVRKSLPGVRFLIIGPVHQAHATYFSELRRLQHELALDDTISWLGERRDTHRYLPAMDLFVVSSTPRSEGTTTTAMEALACGVPVVATRVGAVHEVVVDGLTGRLVRPLDPDALADAMSGLLRDAAVRQRFAVDGRAHIVANFDLELCASRYAAALAAALAYHSRRRHI